MKDALMEYETIDSDQINDIMARKKPRPPADWSDDDDVSVNAKAKAKPKKSKSKSGPSGKIGDPAAEH